MKRVAGVGVETDGLGQHLRDLRAQPESLLSPFRSHQWLPIALCTKPSSFTEAGGPAHSTTGVCATCSLCPTPLSKGSPA